jgi:ABC-type sugar transport system ATPase subunit
MDALLRMIGMSKSFPGVTALCTVDFDLMPGEVHALSRIHVNRKGTLKC